MTSATSNGTPRIASDAARRFLAAGFAPIPLQPRSKRPTLEGWPEVRVVESDIDKMFPAGSNVGLLVGEPSGGLLDVDLDSPQAIRAASILLPKTEMISGRNSAPTSHWWYRVDTPPEKASGKFLDPSERDERKSLLLELRSTGGQTVVPPSIYPADPEKDHPHAEPCVWHLHGEPAHVDLNVLRVAVRSLAAASLLGRHWPRGSRHDASLALAGGLLRAGWAEERVEKFIRGVCNAADDREVSDRIAAVKSSAERIRSGETATGWPAFAKLLGANGEAIIRRVREWLGMKSDPKHVIGARRESDVGPFGCNPVQPYRPFPTAMLPPVVKRYVECVASAMNCDSSYSALHAIAMLGSAIGSTHVVSPKKGWREPPYAFAVAIGVSGSTKSPPFRDIEDIAEDINDRLEADYKQAFSVYQAEMQQWQDAKTNGDEVGDRPEKPVERAFSKQDTTIQALAGELQNNPRGILVACDELAGWISGFTRYASRIGSSDLPAWLQLSNAGVVNIIRKTGDVKKIRVRGVGVSVCGTIQPGIIAKAMTEELRAAGLFARLLVAYPPRRKRVWTEAEVEESVRAEFVSLVSELFALEAGTWEGTAKPKPHLVRLTPEAKAAFVRFYNSNGEAMETAGEDEAAARSKLEGYALRFVLIFHCCRHKEDARNHPIDIEDMRNAVTLAEWFVYESARVYALLGESAEERELRELHELVLRLATRPKSDGRITVRDLQRHNGKRFRSSEDAKAALDSLTGAGLGEWEERTVPDGKGGHHPKTFKPRPTSDTSDTCSPENVAEDDPEDDGTSDTRSDTCSPDDFPPEDGSAATPEPDGSSTEDASAASDRLSEVSDCRIGFTTPETLPESRALVGSKCRTPSGSSVGREKFTLVTSVEGLSNAVTAIEDSGGMVGLDTETTGLSHATDRVRLIQLATDRGTFIIDVFAFADPKSAFAELFEVLHNFGIVGHNLGFDLPFLARLGFVPGRVFDTMLASQIMYAGDITARHGLKDVAARVLKIEIDKTEQKAVWSKPLTSDMLRYAATDAELPLQISDKLTPELEAAGLVTTSETENNALACVAWASRQGIGFDRPAWETLAHEAEQRQEQLREQLDAAAPNDSTLTGSRNWDSPNDVKEAFASVGVKIEATDDDTLAGIDHPLAAIVREYRGVAKRVGTYGMDWLRHVHANGRVNATWKQIGAAASGRMSCKEPNLQQLPRDPRYRRCFVATPGRVLVKADYSQIELRIAAKITGDKRMMQAYSDGEDIHTLTARALLGKTDATKADRQLAKAVNFGLLYGQGAKGLMAYALGSYGVHLTEAEATAYRNTFFKTYPGLRKWHNSIGKASIDTRTLAGRRRLAVQRYTEKLNTPVQGTGADGLKRALALLWERRDQCPGAFPVLFVHDEIVVECDEAQADIAIAWVRSAMLDGMTPLVNPIPVEVEVSIGKTWAG